LSALNNLIGSEKALHEAQAKTELAVQDLSWVWHKRWSKEDTLKHLKAAQALLRESLKRVNVMVRKVDKNASL
jgi:predicted oxidoreductase